MPIEWRKKSHYKLLEKYNDQISKKIKDLYNTGKFHLENDISFTLKQKFDDAKKNFIGYYGGTNSWVEQLFLYDLPTDYNYDNIEISLKKLQNGEYQSNKQCSDTQYAKNINFFIKTFFSEFAKQDDLTWIIKHNRKLFASCLKHRIDNKRSVSTLNGDIKTIARIMKIAFGEEHELYHKYSQLQTDLNVILIEKETGKNTLNKYEEAKFIPFEQILQVRDKLEQEWRTHMETFGVKHKLTWKLHYRMLLLSAYTLTPCVRKELMVAKFATSQEDMNDEKFDYVFLNLEDSDSIAEYNFRLCKKGKHAERYSVGYSTESSKKLTDIFKESIGLYKREFVFPKLSNLKQPAHVNTVNRIFETIIDGKKLGVNMLRSSYVTWRNNTNGLNYNQMKEDAIRLRNSVDTQLRDYRKQVNNPQQTQDTSNIVLEPTKNVKKHQHPPEYYIQKDKDYHKAYYLKNKVEILNKKKDYTNQNKDRINAMQLLRKLSKTQKAPSDKMIQKYKLYLCNDTNIWKSELIN